MVFTNLLPLIAVKLRWVKPNKDYLRMLTDFFSFYLLKMKLLSFLSGTPVNLCDPACRYMKLKTTWALLRNDPCFFPLTPWTLIPDFRLGSSSDASASTPELLSLCDIPKGCLLLIPSTVHHARPLGLKMTQSKTMGSIQESLVFNFQQKPDKENKSAWEASSESRGFGST